MLSIILVLSLFLFGSLFPIFLWVTASGEIDPRFHRLILGLATLVGGMGTVLFWLMNGLFHVKLSAAVWFISLLAVTWFYWNRPRVHPWVVTIPPFLGVVVVGRMITTLSATDLTFQGVSILGGLILGGSIFSMILGHRYLNVVNLSIGLLRRAVRWLLVLLVVRFLWDMCHLFVGKVDSGGNLLSILEFVGTINGFFLGAALFSGTILPLILCLFTLHTVKIHSTQSATGLLYVVVILVVMGDLLYKYYALQFGVFL